MGSCQWQIQTLSIEGEGLFFFVLFLLVLLAFLPSATFFVFSQNKGGGGSSLDLPLMPPVFAGCNIFCQKCLFQGLSQGGPGGGGLFPRSATDASCFCRVQHFLSKMLISGA